MLGILAAVVIESLQPVHILTIQPHQAGVGHFTYARDAQFEYLGTPRGLYRAQRLATGTPQLIAFANEPVTTIAVHNGSLYAALGLSNSAYHTPHSLLRSRDRGTTFAPVDAGIFDCSLQPWGEPCRPLVVRQIEAQGSHIFIEAAGNVLVSADDAATWQRLFPSAGGKPAAQTCPTVFTRIGQRMLLGGECPLDFGWLGAGTLRSDLLDWVSEPRRFELPIENRNAHFIRHVGNGVVYAGIEGALLKSTDNGATWRFVLHYPLEDVWRYPYAYHLLVTPQLMLLGGFDKKNETGYLAYSTDDGETWVDVSSLVGNAHVELLAEDADGRLLLGLMEGRTFTLAQVVPGERTFRKRRAARP